MVFKLLYQIIMLYRNDTEQWAMLRPTDTFLAHLGKQICRRGLSCHNQYDSANLRERPYSKSTENSATSCRFHNVYFATQPDTAKH